MKQKIVRFILSYIAPPLICLLGRSLRLSVVNSEHLRQRGERGESCIFCFWHNRILLMPYLYRFIRGRKNIYAMASKSRDGQHITDVLHGFGFEVARGSSSRGGDTAINEMLSGLKMGLDAAVTPDGPRGPLYEVQPGVVRLSQFSGVPIIPITFYASWKIRLRSWDRFIVPLPFSKAAFVIGKPVFVTGDKTSDDIDRIRCELERSMRKLDNRTAELLGISSDP